MVSLISGSSARMMVGTSTRSLVGVTAPRFSRGHHNDRWMVSSARTSWSEAYFPIRAASKLGVDRGGELGRRPRRRVARAVAERAGDGTGGIVEVGSLDLMSREIVLELREIDRLGAGAIEHARTDEQHDQDDGDAGNRPTPDLFRTRGGARASPPRSVAGAHVLRLTTHADHRRRHRHKAGPRAGSGSGSRPASAERHGASVSFGLDRNGS